MLGTIIAAIILACKAKLGMALAVTAAAKFLLTWSIVTTSVCVGLSLLIFIVISLLAGFGAGLEAGPIAGVLGFLGVSTLGLLGTAIAAIQGCLGIFGALLLKNSVTIPATGNPVWNQTTLIIGCVLLGLNVLVRLSSHSHTSSSKS